MLLAVQDSPRQAVLRRAMDTQRRAVGWLEEHAVPTCESEVGRAHLYRLPYALSVAGRPEAALGVFDVFADAVLTPEGDLRAGPLQQRFTHRWASYPLTVLASGAWSVGLKETARLILRNVAERFVDAEHGGALGERPEVRTGRRQDLFPTAQMGIAASMAGERALAIGAARWVERLVERQPTPEEAFCVSTEGGAPILEDPGRPGEAGSPLDFNRDRQPVASLGIGAALLAEIGHAYDQQELIPVAEHLQGLYRRLDPNAYEPGESAQMCKRAWGACALYRVTHDPRHLEDIVEMMGWFERGLSNGDHWTAPAHLRASTASPPAVIDAEITTEFVQHLSLIAATLQLPDRGDRS